MNFPHCYDVKGLYCPNCDDFGQLARVEGHDSYVCFGCKTLMDGVKVAAWMNRKRWVFADKPVLRQLPTGKWEVREGP